MRNQKHTTNEGTTCRFSLGIAPWGMIAFTFLSTFTLAALACEATAQEPRKAGKEGRILVTLEWGDVPLRERLMEFGKKYSVAVFLDRRVDPDQRIELSVSDQPVEGVLAQAAEKLKLGTCTIGKTHYIGPKSTVSRLPGVVAQRKSGLPVQSRAAWNKSKELKWDEAATPRAIAAALAQEGGTTLVNAEQIPHDVWPAYDLPAMTLTERLSLVLAGFDLTYQVASDGTSLRVVPMPQEKAYASVHTLPADAANIAAQVQRLFPTLKMERSGNRLTVVATLDEHDRIDELLQTGQTKTVTKVTNPKTYSLTVKNQAAGAVVNTVAKQLGKEFQYDLSLRDKLKEDDSFTVKDVSLEELLTKTLKPLGLSYKLTDTAIEIIPLP